MPFASCWFFRHFSDVRSFSALNHIAAAIIDFRTDPLHQLRVMQRRGGFGRGDVGEHAAAALVAGSGADAVDE